MTTRNDWSSTKANVITFIDSLFDELSTKNETLATLDMDGKPISIGRSVKSSTKFDVSIYCDNTSKR